MVTLTSSQKSTLLSKSVTVSKYLEMENAQDKTGISDFIRKRFTERYILPMNSRYKHGFSIMAICCLMIEALESFKQGWKDTRGWNRIAKMHNSELAFHLFFQTETSFQDFIGFENEFYGCVRCGILHQAEAIQGWHIIRKRVLFDEKSKTINATVFLRRLNRGLNTYCDALKSLEWNSNEWTRLRDKMQHIISNC